MGYGTFASKKREAVNKKRGSVMEFFRKGTNFLCTLMELIELIVNNIEFVEFVEFVDGTPLTP